MRIKIYVVVIVILAIAAAAYAAFTQDRRPDVQQIQDLLKRGETSVEQRSLSGAMSCISDSYSDKQGLKYDQIRLLAANAFHDARKIEVDVSNPTISVQGQQASAGMSVSVRTGEGADRQSRAFNAVTISLAREPVRHLLVFPAKEWKVVEIEGLGDLMSE
jgi:hypothetical protein